MRRTRFVCILELSLSEEDTVCMYSRPVLSVLVRTRFVCILELSSQCLSEEDTVCVYSRTQVLVRRTLSQFSVS